MDTVVGKVKSKACLLVLTERKTRREIVRKMPDKSMESMVRTFGEVLSSGAYSKEDFKTITSDNGSEFMNADYFEGMGIPYFYAHSFCSYERATKTTTVSFGGLSQREETSGIIQMLSYKR